MISFIYEGVNIIIATDSHPQSSCSVWFLRTFHIYSREIHTDSSLYKLINYSHMMSLTPSNHFILHLYLVVCFPGKFFTMNFAPTATPAAGQQTFVVYVLWHLSDVNFTFFLLIFNTKKKSNKRIRRKRNRSLIYQNITMMNIRKYRMAF